MLDLLYRLEGGAQTAKKADHQQVKPFRQHGGPAPRPFGHALKHLRRHQHGQEKQVPAIEPAVGVQGKGEGQQDHRPGHPQRRPGAGRSHIPDIDPLPQEDQQRDLQSGPSVGKGQQGIRRQSAQSQSQRKQDPVTAVGLVDPLWHGGGGLVGRGGGLGCPEVGGTPRFGGVAADVHSSSSFFPKKRVRIQGHAGRACPNEGDQ